MFLIYTKHVNNIYINCLRDLIEKLLPNRIIFKSLIEDVHQLIE